MIDLALLAEGDFTLLRAALVRALGGNANDALVLQRLHWRCLRPNSDGWWTGTYAELGEECGLSADQVSRSVRKLREAGHIETQERGTSIDRTLSYRVITVSD